jgi:hypothetical protein
MGRACDKARICNPQAWPARSGDGRRKVLGNKRWARNLATGLDRIIVDRFLACLKNGEAVGQSCFNIDLPRIDSI